MSSPLRAPGEPRSTDPSIPGFGICSHPDHGTVVWLVEGEILDGNAIGRCVKHSSEIDKVAADIAAAYPISVDEARHRLLVELGLLDGCRHEERTLDGACAHCSRTDDGHEPTEGFS